jgi:hypothetical protein
MKLSELNPESVKVIESPAGAQPLKLSDLKTDDVKVLEHSKLYEKPIGPEQDRFIDRVAERVKDPKRWQAMLGKGPYAADVVQGDAPLVIPAGAPIAAAGKIPEALGYAGKIAENAMRAPEMLSKAAIALDAGKGIGYTLGRTGLNAAQGAALSAMGGEEGESLSDKMERAKKGGIVGAGVQLAAEGIPYVGGKIARIPGNLIKKAEERAFKSAGAMLKDYRKAGNPERVEEIGRFMLDNKLTRPGMTVADVAEESTTLRNTIGQKIGDAYERAKSALSGVDLPEANLDPKKLADEFMSDFAVSQKGMPGASARIRSVQSVVDDLKELPGDGGFSAVNEFRQNLDDLLYAHDKTPGTLPETKQGMQEFRKWIDTRVDKAIDAIDRATGGQVSKELPQLNRQYGVASEVAKISKDQAFRQNANRFFSPSDWASAGTGAVIGASTGDDIESKVKGAIAGATLGAVNKARRKYGTPLVSQALDVTGIALSKPTARMAKATAPLAESGSGIAASTVHALSSPGKSSQVSKAASAVAEGEKEPNRAPAKGEAAWLNRGAERLGLSSEQLERLSRNPKTKDLIMQASDLPAGSAKLQRIFEQMKKGGAYK